MQAVSYNTFCLKKSQLLMDQPLPSSFEVVVVGTGLEESVVAAAAARLGHSVLHIDPNDYYGDAWAAFSFDGLQQWIGRNENDEEEKVEVKVDEGLLKEGEKLVLLDRRRKVFRKVKQEWGV